MLEMLYQMLVIKLSARNEPTDDGETTPATVKANHTTNHYQPQHDYSSNNTANKSGIAAAAANTKASVQQNTNSHSKSFPELGANGLTQHNQTSNKGGIMNMIQGNKNDKDKTQGGMLSKFGFGQNDDKGTKFPALQK
eukprot:TRINITY_DN50293_c0_g1_i1.p2 TRINITY_DN50293_c0_g1~~TRINITY_DN50293_c0_g1_i1.p2  ORF type:complete len:138 (+),score=8.96 TRINITY_DN50293_c0_g1_i1:963-1376(+)